MAKKRRKTGNSPNLGQIQTFEIHFFVPGKGFGTKFYDAPNKEKALEALKSEFPKAQAFWVGRPRGKALAGPQTRHYVIWWKFKGRFPRAVFILDHQGNLMGSLPPDRREALDMAWNLAQRRNGQVGNYLEEVDEITASLIGNEILIQNDRLQEQILRDFEAEF